MTVDYCNLTEEQYDELTEEQYDTMLDCDGDLEGHNAKTNLTPKQLRRLNRQNKLRPELRPILIPFLTLEELDELGEGGMI